jgi:hypothetical protein
MNGLDTVSVDTTAYKNARKDTVLGEKKLLKEEYNEANETEFAKQIHTAKNLSEHYQGQQLSVTVAATPRGGIRRKDRYTGSIQVSDVILTGDKLKDIQKDNLLTDHAPKVKKEFETFKKFVSDTLPTKQTDIDTNVTLEKYQTYIKTRELPTEWTSLGIAATKPPVMFETRAMIQGNRCMNYTVGIGYPVFTINQRTQTQVPVVNVEGSTPLNIQAVKTNRLDVGVSTIGAIDHARSGKINETGQQSKPGAK